MASDAQGSDEHSHSTVERAVKEEAILTHVIRLMVLTALVAVLFVGSLVSIAGWIPKNYLGNDSILRTHAIWPYAGAAAALAALKYFLHLRALVMGNARTVNLAELYESLMAVIVFLGLFGLAIGFYGGLSRLLFQRYGQDVSTLMAAGLGLAVVTSVFGAALLAHRWLPTRTPSASFPRSGLDEPMADAATVLLVIPLAAFLGWLNGLLGVMLIERLGWTVDDAFKATVRDDLSFACIFAGAVLVVGGMLQFIRVRVTRSGEPRPTFRSSVATITLLLLFSSVIGQIMLFAL